MLTILTALQHAVWLFCLTSSGTSGLERTIDVVEAVALRVKRDERVSPEAITGCPIRARFKLHSASAPRERGALFRVLGGVHDAVG